jgi:hypothetical protein
MDEVNRFVCQIYGDDIPGYKSCNFSIILVISYSERTYQGEEPRLHS